MKPDYINFLLNTVKLKPSNTELTSNATQEITCLLCFQTFIAAVKGKVNNFRRHRIPGCSTCTAAQRYTDIRSDNVSKLNEKFIILNLPDTLTNEYMLQVTNRACRHTFTSRAGNLLNRNVICPVCNTAQKQNRLKKFNKEKHEQSLVTKVGFAAYVQKVHYLTSIEYIKHIDKINPNNFPRVQAKAGNVGYHLDHIVSKKYCYLNNIPPEICANYQNLQMIPWQDNVKKYSKPVLAKLPEIFYKYITSPEKINDFISSIRSTFTDATIHTYPMLNDRRVTIKINDTYILFCCFEDYRHQVLNDKYYLHNFRAANPNIIIVFEDEFAENPTIILSKIAHILNLNTKLDTIYARKCTIAEISVKEKNKFLNTFHIQGTCPSTINLGAYFNEQLIAVMTFALPRILMNKRSQPSGTYELTRFATNINVRCVGISGKLLTHFKRNYSWASVYSYADKRWSRGNMYTALGFSLTANNPPDYSYIVDGVRKHRWGFRKDIIREKYPNIYNIAKTEYEMMLMVGYDKIWDCGTLKFTITNK